MSQLQNSSILVNTLRLDRHQPIALSRQLYTQLHQQILQGKISYQARLPATRILARELGVARGVIVECYDMLKSDGLIAGFGKGGTRVCYQFKPVGFMSATARKVNTNKLPKMELSQRGRMMANAREYQRTYNASTVFPLAPDVPDFSLFPQSKWQRISKEALETSPNWYQRDGGIDVLKKSLKTYLSQYRGIEIDNLNRLLITTGTQASLSFLTQMLTEPNESILLDKPGWMGATAAAKHANLDIIYAPVDDYGTALSSWEPSSDSQQLKKSKSFSRTAISKIPKIAIITPTMQFPTGRPMSMQRRDEIIRYTAAHNTWLIEDDYAAEYSYEQHPLPSILAHNQTEHVIHVGTMNKLLLPSLRLGWMVVPESLADPMNHALNTTGLQPSYIIQQHLGLFMRYGYLNTHLHHTRAIYNERKQQFLSYFEQHAPTWLSTTPSISGMNHYVKIDTAIVDYEKLAFYIQVMKLGCKVFQHPTSQGNDVYLLIGTANFHGEETKGALEVLFRFN